MGAAPKTGWTPKKRAEFLRILAETGNATLSARAVGLSKARAFAIRKNDTEFARLWDEAIDEAVDVLESEAKRRAFQGVPEPVFYQGQECGSVQRYSDSLLMFLLKGYRPTRFTERHQHELSGKDGGPITVVRLVADPADDEVKQ